MKTVAALLCGVLFGAGLSLSGMTDPARVLGFLDLAGRWDPSLAFVMGAALMVSTPAFWLARRSGAQPLVDTRFHMPQPAAIDRRVIGGSILFGMGWGVAGLCPGPALANLVTGLWPLLVFVLCMAGGMWLHDLLDELRQRAPKLQAAGTGNPT